MFLANDLESIRSLFSRKEKELSLAVNRVEELTRQLEGIRRGAAEPNTPGELDKLKQELVVSNTESREVVDFVTILGHRQFTLFSMIFLSYSLFSQNNANCC